MKPYTLCRFNWATMPQLYHAYYEELLELDRPNDPVLLLHEISNMPGHWAVATKKTGKVIYALHDDNFIELTEEEV